MGLSRYHRKAHLARATLEAICFQTRAVLDAMIADSSIALDVLKVDGGATVNDTLLQLQADILGVPVVRPVITETTALGAAYAAGLAAGVWKDLAELERSGAPTSAGSRGGARISASRAYAGWKKAVERTFNWIDLK